MSMRRIIHVSSYYPPHLGGQENAAHSLVQQLAAAGHRAYVLASSLGNGPRGNRLEDSVNVRRLWGFVFGHAPIMPWFPVALFHTARTDSIVHIHIGQAFTPEMVWLVSKLRRFNYVAQLHIDFKPSGRAGILLPLYKRYILKHVLHSASAVIVLNEETLHTVRKVYGYTGRAQVMNNGIDEVYFGLKRTRPALKPSSTLRLLFVGRLSKQKNVLVLLEAIQQTKRRVHLDIIGDGDEFELLQKIIVDNNLSNVTLHGRLERTQVMHFYQTCDALIMPSLYEAQPLVLLEALAMRIPIIGTNVIGIAEHIKDAGILVEPTADGIMRGIEQYDEYYPFLPRMVERGYAMAEKLRWSHTLKAYETLYDAVARD